MHPRRSFLFVPGSRPELFTKALATGADVVCVDLEDAVAPQLKPAARAPSRTFLAGADGSTERALRINPVRSIDGIRDLATLADGPPIGSGLLVLTKVDDAEELRIVDAVLSEHGSQLEIVVLIETARGLENVMAIAAAPRVACLLFGAIDLSAELGIPVAHEPLLYARSRVVHAAKRAGVGVFDVPCLDFKNLDIVRNESEVAKHLGFTGKAVLHPSNVAIVNEVFTPSAAEVRQAEAVIAAFRSSATGLVVVDGKLIERPVVRASERILARAAAIKA